MSYALSTTGRQEIVGIQFRAVGNVVRNADSAYARDKNNILKPWLSALEATATPESVGGFGNSSSTVTVSTGSTTASPAGGVSPFTYLWEAVDATGWGIEAPTAQTTSFSNTVGPGDALSGIFRCKITDNSDNIVYTNQVTATVHNLGGPL